MSVSKKSGIAPIPNKLGGKSLIGTPTSGDAPIFDKSANAFVYQPAGGGGGIQSINGSILANQVINAGNSINVATNVGLGQTTINVLDNGIDTQQLANGSVVTSKLQSGAVTNAKVNDVDPDKLNQVSAQIGDVLTWTANAKWEPEPGGSGAVKVTNQICLPYFSGNNGGADSPSDTQPSGQSCIGVGDDDTTRLLVHDNTISVATGPQSLHSSDDITSYQNNSGFNAMLIMVLNVTIVDGGGLSIKFNIYDSPNDNSIAGATLRYEDLGGTANLLNLLNAKQTIPPIKISNGNFCVVEVTSVAGGALNVVESFAYVVERSS